jgi:hypothetical protein
MDRVALRNLVDPKTSELLVRPSSFCEAVLEMYASSEDFRKCFAYDQETERAIVGNFYGNEQKFVSQMLSHMVGLSFNETGSIMMHDDEFYAGYMKAKSDWGFDVFVFEDRGGDDDIAVALMAIDDTMSVMDVDCIAAKESMYYLMGGVFYKDKGEDAFKMDWNGTGDVSFQSIRYMQNWIFENMASK